MSIAMTGRVLTELGELGGPRCCKRNAFVALRSAVGYTREELGVEMELGQIVCRYSRYNNQCHKKACSFNQANYL